MKKEIATRFSVSLPPALLEQLDKMTGEKGYDNRSLAIADMIRAQLIEHRQKTDSGEIAGTITLVYDHHKPHLQASLTDIQHDHHDAILSTVHVHLDHHNCLEVLIVRGKASVIRKIADELIAAKGVKHGKLTVTTTGRTHTVTGLPPCGETRQAHRDDNGERFARLTSNHLLLLSLFDGALAGRLSYGHSETGQQIAAI